MFLLAVLSDNLFSSGILYPLQNTNTCTLASRIENENKFIKVTKV